MLEEIGDVIFLVVGRLAVKMNKAVFNPQISRLYTVHMVPDSARLMLQPAPCARDGRVVKRPAQTPRCASSSPHTSRGQFFHTIIQAEKK